MENKENVAVINENLSLAKNWMKRLKEDKVVEGRTTTSLLQTAKIYDNQLAESATEGIYESEHVIDFFKNGVEKATGKILEAVDKTQEDGEALTEGVVIGDHGYDPVKIASGEMSGSLTNAGPAVLGMVRRIVPNLIAMDVCGVQTMSVPSGQYFALRAMYGGNGLDENAKEMFHPEFAPDIMHSGRGTDEKFEAIEASKTLDYGKVYTFEFKFKDGEDRTEAKYAVLETIGESGIAFLQCNNTAGLTAPSEDELIGWVVDQMMTGDLFELGEAMATSIAELIEGYNGSKDNPWAEVSYRIDKKVHEAKTRKLKGTTSVENIQDMRNIMGYDVVSMLSTIIVDELTLEVNREVIHWINYSAELGKTGRTRTPKTKAGVFDFQDVYDTRGARWAGESFKAIIYQIEKEANEILRRTGRGRGNVMIASPGVVTALASVPEAFTPAVGGKAQGYNLDYTKSTYAGNLGNIKVFIDQFARFDYFTLGYRGADPIDAGLIFSPYILLTPKQAVDYRNFSPVIGFISRYALAMHPMVDSRIEKPSGRIESGMPSADVIRRNSYFRTVRVLGL